MTEKSILVIQTNAVSGRDVEFNEWYDSIHLDDVLGLPGVVAAQRFRFMMPRDANAPPPQYRYLALYEIEGDPATTVAALDEAIANGMVISDAMEHDRFAYVYAPITERRTAADG